MKVKFKMIKKPTAVCPVCGSPLMGDNSGWNPYTCSKCDCIWKANFTDPTNFEMKKREIL